MADVNQIVYNTEADEVTPLADQPYLVAQDAGTNEVLYSNSFLTSGSGWAINTTNTADQIGITGLPNDAVKMIDAGGTALYSQYGYIGSAPLPNTSVVRIFIKQETSATANVGLHYQTTSGGTAENSYISLNVNTGAYLVAVDDTGTLAFDIESINGWWHIYITADAVDQLNSRIYCTIYPSYYLLNSTTPSASATGTITVGNYELHVDKTIEQVKSLGPIFTSGSTASTSELRNVYPSANHSNTEGPLYIEFENTGDDVVLMKVGTDEVWKVEDGGSGAELSTNGTFDTDTGWTKEAGWTISGGTANKAADTGREIRQDFTATAGNKYYVEFSLVSVTAGYVGGYSLESEEGAGGVVYETTLGVHSFILTATATTVTMRFRSSTSSVLSIDNVSVREVDGKYIKLTDGTTQIQTACAAGEHKAGIAFSDEDSLMNLNLDDSWETQAAYDGTLGSGDISLGETCRNVKRWNETDFDKQKALIDKEMT